MRTTPGTESKTREPLASDREYDKARDSSAPFGGTGDAFAESRFPLVRRGAKQHPAVFIFNGLNADDDSLTRGSVSTSSQCQTFLASVCVAHKTVILAL